MLKIKDVIKKSFIGNVYERFYYRLIILFWFIVSTTISLFIVSY